MFNLEIWGFVSGIAGILLSVYFYKKQIVRKSASYRIYSYILLGGAEGILPPEIVIHFQHKRIFHLKKMTVIFWNSGDVTIDRNDIVQMDPLRIVVTDNIDVLKASIVRQSKKTNNATIFSHNSSKKEVCFDFDYLESKQGLNIEILYQGEYDVKIMGTIKGVPEGLHDMAEREGIQHRRFWIFNTIIYLLLCIPGFTLFIIPEFLTIIPKEYFPPIINVYALWIFFVTFALGCAQILLSKLIQSHYIMSRVKPPKDLDVWKFDSATSHNS